MPNLITYLAPRRGLFISGPFKGGMLIGGGGLIERRDLFERGAKQRDCGMSRKQIAHTKNLCQMIACGNRIHGQISTHCQLPAPLPPGINIDKHLWASLFYHSRYIYRAHWVGYFRGSCEEISWYNMVYGGISNFVHLQSP